MNAPATPVDASATDPTPALTTRHFPASHKIHVPGSIHPTVRVPMREIALTPASTENPEAENADGDSAEAGRVTVYDTSGPYTDPDATIDLRRGLPPLRHAWIEGRQDVEPYAGRTVAAKDNGRGKVESDTPVERFPESSRRPPLRAKTDIEPVLS